MNCAGTPELYTPNLNRIAERGVMLESFFCASPVCSPARASLLTGKMPSAHGVLDWLRGGNVDSERFRRQGEENPYAGGDRGETKPIPYLKEQRCYTDILKEAGYRLSLSGKWHLGDSVTPQHGFDDWYTIGMGGCCYYHPDIVDHGEITVRHGEYVTELITDRALRDLDELAAGPEPFYLAVHYTAPHSPWDAKNHPARWIDYYDGCSFPSIPDVPDHPDITTGPVFGTPKRHENLRGYFAAVSAMDEQIGRILDALEEKGLAEETIVIFSADNGMNMGQHGIWGKGNGTFPMNMYDTSVKVPFLISCPARLPQGVRCDALVSAYDLYPTILELTGLSEQFPEGLPGRSFAGSLSGGGAEDREVVVFDEYGPVRMIRDREWKLIVRYPYGGNEFYHLTEDPGENRNLYGAPEYEEKIIAMRRRMEAWFVSYSDPYIAASAQGVTGSGQLCRPGIYADRLEPYAPLSENS